MEDLDDVAEHCAEEVTQLVGELFEAILPSEEAFATLMDLIGERVEAALAARTRQPPACGAGCSSCCTLNVGTLAVEGAAAAAFLRRTLGPAEAVERAKALLDFHERVRWLDDAERIREKLSCPFLDGSRSCAIHPVRPLACRSISSLDPADCRRAVAEAAGDDGPRTVPMDLLQLSICQAALGALSRALTARGLDGRMRDVTGMTGAFLADAELAFAYGSGARVPIE